MARLEKETVNLFRAWLLWYPRGGGEAWIPDTSGVAFLSQRKKHWKNNEKRMEAEEMHWKTNEKLGKCMQERGARACARARARARVRARVLDRPWAAHGPPMDHFGMILLSFRDYVGIILGQFSVHFEIVFVLSDECRLCLILFKCLV